MIPHSHSMQEHDGADPAFSDLRVWEKSFDLAVGIFRIAERIPQDIGLGLSAQMRIVALSVPSYVARAQSRATNQEALRALHHTRAALSDLGMRKSLCAELGYATDLEIRDIDAQIREVARMIDSMIVSLRGILGHGAPVARAGAAPRPTGPRAAAAGP